MSNLADRVRAIVRGGSAPPRRELTYEPEEPGYQADKDLDRVADALAAVTHETAAGRCLRVDRRYESDRWHGDVRIGDCELTDLSALQILDPGFAAQCSVAHGFSRAIYLDIETTGLSGGAGTVVFLVGCGYFDLGAFQVHQFLLPAYAAERALLAAVAVAIADADLLVTFNGKTFDLPVMETRWLFHRMATPLAEKPHFDMLHPARRLWRYRDTEDGCRLSVLERELFGMRRVGDVPGFEIPSRYFRYLRSGNPAPLEAVLEHNRIDLVSLAAVMARAAALAAGGPSACRNGRERLALGRMLERASRESEAEACYRDAAGDPHEDVRAEALCRLALRLRRARRHAEAAEAWEQVLALDDRHVLAREALAVHNEHRVRDLDTARTLAVGALARDLPPGRREALRYRIARLERKLAAVVHTKGGETAAPLLDTCDL